MNIKTHGFVFEHGEVSKLNDESVLKALLYELTELAKLTPLTYSSHIFEPQGISSTLILSESHIAAHTWPENGAGYIILTSCKDQSNEFIDQASALIASSLGAKVNTAKELL